MNIEEMRLMKTEEEVRNRARELLQMPKVEVLTRYMFQEQEIERLNNIINELEEFLNEVMESYGYETDITDRIEKITIKNILRKLKELKEKK